MVTYTKLFVVSSFVFIASAAAVLFMFLHYHHTGNNNNDKTDNFTTTTTSSATPKTYIPQTAPKTALTSRLAAINLQSQVQYRCYDDKGHPTDKQPVNWTCPNNGGFMGRVVFTPSQIADIEQFATLMFYPTAAEYKTNDKHPNPLFFDTHKNFLVDEIDAGIAVNIQSGSKGPYFPHAPLPATFTSTMVNIYIMYLNQTYPIWNTTSITGIQMLQNAEKILGFSFN